MTNVNLNGDALINYVMAEFELWKSFGYRLDGLNKMISILTELRDERIINKLNTLENRIETKKDS